MTMQEGNMDWLTNTPFPMKERGFLFLIMLPVCAVISRAGGLLTNGYITKTVVSESNPKTDELVIVLWRRTT